jgi:hypothetical protein
MGLCWNFRNRAWFETLRCSESNPGEVEKHVDGAALFAIFHILESISGDLDLLASSVWWSIQWQKKGRRHGQLHATTIREIFIFLHFTRYCGQQSLT